MGLSHSFATWFILRRMEPSLVVESGVWKGHSTWLIEQACPQARLVCLDPDFSRLEYRSSKAQYLSRDFAEVDWSEFDTSRAIGFFDDHQNEYARLKDLWWAGFRHAIFEDNFPCGEGDCYSLKHVMAGFGHPRPQMSESYRSRGWWSRKRELLREGRIAWLGVRQQLIVPPNSADRGNLHRRLESYLEFPPLLLGERTVWKTDWSGPYSTPAPLLRDGKDPLAAAVRRLDGDLFYGYLAYVALRA